MKKLLTDLAQGRSLVICLMVSFLPILKPASAKVRPAMATDTIWVTLPQAETLFLQRNLGLIAQKYAISQTEAAVIQAKLFPNPNASFEYNLYNPATKTFFPTDKSASGSGYKGGQYIFNIQQLIQTAGKRNRLIDLANVDTRLATYQFADALRSLRLMLRSTYASLYYGQRQLTLYQQEQARLEQLLGATRLGAQQGIISTYEVTRLEAEQQDLASTVADVRAQLSSQEADFKMLLAEFSTQAVLPSAEPALRTLPQTATLRDSALARRPDYQYALALAKRADLNLAYQKAQAVPDVVVGYNHESLGNAFINYNGLNVGMQLPFFSRNQGQIQAAKVGQKVAENSIAQAQATVFADVESAQRALVAYQSQAALIKPEYQSRLSKLSTEADMAYRKRIISLLDYLDKFRTYKSGSVNQLHLQQNIFLSTETLATAVALP